MVRESILAPPSMVTSLMPTLVPISSSIESWPPFPSMVNEMGVEGFPIS